MRDSDTNIAANYAKLHSAVGMHGHTRCWTHQAHSPEVVVVEEGSQRGVGWIADGLVTDLNYTALAVRYADCSPLLAYNIDTHRIGAFHIGWKGAARGMVKAAVTHMGAPNRTRFAIGPTIGTLNFEVGADVRSAFAHEKWIRSPFHSSSITLQKYHLDLTFAIYQLLINEGVVANFIDCSDICTYTNPDFFFSERRDGVTTGRMAALISRAGD